MKCIAKARGYVDDSWLLYFLSHGHVINFPCVVKGHLSSAAVAGLSRPLCQQPLFPCALLVGLPE